MGRHAIIFCLFSLLLTAYAIPAKDESENVRGTRNAVHNEVLDPLSQKRFDSFTNGFGQSKRSFDEISRSSFGFNKRRNYDGVGRIPFAFSANDNVNDLVDQNQFAKRDFDEIGRSSFGFNKRITSQEEDPYLFNHKRDFDEIDRSAFGFTKRGDFDEIGRSSFGFYRRSPQKPKQWRFLSGFGKRGTDAKRNFDEISRTSFGFNRRSDNN